MNLTLLYSKLLVDNYMKKHISPIKLFTVSKILGKIVIYSVDTKGI